VSVLGAFRSHRAGSVDGRPLLPPSGQPRGRAFAGPVAVRAPVGCPRQILERCGQLAPSRRVAAPSDRVPRRWAARRPASCRGGSALIAALGAGCRARCPSAGTLSQRVGGRSTIRTSRHHKSDHSLMSAAPGRDLVQLWLGPRPCSPRSPAGSTISVECAVCGVDVPTSWNVRPSAGITSRRMGPESIQRAPRPTSGTPSRRRCHPPGRSRPPAGHPEVRRTATGPEATDKAGCPRRSRQNPPRLSTICDTRGGRPVHAPRPGPAKAPSRREGLPGGRQ